MSDQERMWDHEDLPLWSDAAPTGHEERYDPEPEPVQSRLFDCAICQGTGYVKDGGKLKRCPCGAGDTPQV